MFSMSTTGKDGYPVPGQGTDIANQQLFGTLTPTVPCAFGTTYSTKLRDPQRNTGST